MKHLILLSALCPLLSGFSATLTHGPLVGRPQPDSMRIWVRTSEPCAFRIRFDRKAELGEASQVVEGHTSAERDNTGTVDLTGLQAAKTYFYAVEVDGKVTGGFHFRTWASDKTFAHPVTNPQGLAITTVGIGVCNHITGAKKTAVYRTLLEKHTKKLDLFIMDGDFIYELKRTQIKPNEITTETAREDYRSYLEGVPDMSRFMVVR
jgi:phosphodiesterase/alkaline phosphatase D-like protein